MKTLFILILLSTTGCSTIQNALGTAKTVMGEAADAKLVNDLDGLCASNSTGAIFRAYTMDEYATIRKVLGCQGKQ